MASSGTLGLTIHSKLQPNPLRESVMVMGYVRTKAVATIEAMDLEMKTIKAFVATPQHTTDIAARGPVSVFGSVTVPGSLGNSVYIQSMIGSLKNLGMAAAGYPGTPHIGTVLKGTTPINFFAMGA